MAADSDRRTEPATRRRMLQARDQGRLAKSRDLATVLMLCAVLASVAAGDELWTGRLRALLRQVLGVAAQGSATAPDLLAATLWSIAATVLTEMLAVVAVVVVAAILAQGVQTGWMFAPRALGARLENFDWGRNLKMLMQWRTGIDALMALIKVALLVLVLSLIVRHALPTLVRLPLLSSLSLPQVLLQMLAGFVALMLLALAPLALFDLWYQRRQGGRALRMTRDEARREQREDQGDPHLRGHRRALNAQMLHDSPLQRTVHATLVLCDLARTQAVAILRDPDSTTRPWLLNKGRGGQALAILAVARRHNIRIVEHGALAARIMRDVSIDGDLNDELAALIVSGV